MNGDSSRLTYRDMVLAIFRGQDPGGVLWQPRLEFWYAVNKKRGTLPAHLKEADLLDVYDYCHASVRYFGSGLRVRYKNVQIRSEWLDEKRIRSTWETPVGCLTEVSHYDEWNLSAHLTEYKLKGPEDFKVLEYILQEPTSRIYSASASGATHNFTGGARRSRGCSSNIWAWSEPSS